MHELGQLALQLSLATALFAACLAVVGHVRGRPSLSRASLIFTYAVAAFVTLAAFCMLYLLVVQDLSVKYVHRHTDSSMSMLYLLAAFWGGQEGSLLFWTWMLAAYSAVAIWLNRGRENIISWVNVALVGIIAFFLILLLIPANPFQVHAGEVPAEGLGMNPMLQNPYMVVHPPAMYLGYIGMAIPFAFGVASMVVGGTDGAWLRLTRRWTLAGWLFLSLGLILGKVWAYEELGWGGYWTWDPVENAGLLPWLTCTAFLHSAMIQERRGMFKKWNMALVILSFSFTIVGTFLTRSGVVDSVHAFAQSEIGAYFLVFLALVLAVGFGLMWARRAELTSTARIESVLSREFAFLANNWILVGMAFFVLVATLFPSLSEYFAGEKVTVGEPFFNEWMIPLGLVLLFLTGVGPLFAWRKASPGLLARQLILPVLGGLAAAFAGMLLGALSAGPVPVITYFLAGLVFATVLQEVLLGARARMQNKREGVLTALVLMVARGKRRHGGYAIHLGLALMFVGWTGNAFKIENDTTLHQHEEVEVGRYTVRYDEIDFSADSRREEAVARFTIIGDKGREIGVLEPARWFYRQSGQSTSRVAIRSTPVSDLYLALAGWDPDTKRLAVRVVVHPLVLWIWAGSLLLVLGCFVALWPESPTGRSVRGEGLQAGREEDSFSHGSRVSGLTVYLLAAAGFAFVAGFSDGSDPLAARLAVVLAAAATAAGVLLVGRAVSELRGQGSRLAADRSRPGDLEQEKARVLQVLREIDLDHAMGKIGAGDYQELKESCEAEAYRILLAVREDQAGRLEGLLAEVSAACREQGEGAAEELAAVMTEIEEMERQRTEGLLRERDYAEDRELMIQRLRSLVPRLRVTDGGD